MIAAIVRKWLSFNRNSRTVSNKKLRRAPLKLEFLEDRDCPATFNIAAGDVTGLLAAVAAANANNQPDTINLALGSNYVFSSGINYDAAEFAIVISPDNANAANSVTINGNGATITRSTVAGTPDFHIFAVTGTLILNSVTISNALSDDIHPGAGISVGPGGELTLTNSSVINNTDINQDGGGIGIDLGALAVTIEDTTIANNSDLAGVGGGIVMRGAGGLTIRQSTIAYNSVQSPNMSGGIEVQSGSSATLLNSIVADNTGTYDAENDSGGSITINASIVPKYLNSGTATGTPISVAPLLGPLQNNGGPTDTIALLPGSPAGIDDGNSANATILFDQRGVPRPQGDGFDIGAFEVRMNAIISAGNNQTASGNTNFASPLTVQVVSPDWNGAGVPNETVTFTVNAVNGAGAAITGSSTVITNASGDASVQLISNAVSGSFTVTATFAGASLTFNLTNSSYSQYAYLAYINAYDAYSNANEAYTTGQGSYSAVNFAYSSFYFAYYAYYYSTIGNKAASETSAYYAYYYGYYASNFAYQDYVTITTTVLTETVISGRAGYSTETTTSTVGGSPYSLDAYIYGFLDYTYSYQTALGN